MFRCCPDLYPLRTPSRHPPSSKLASDARITSLSESAPPLGIAGDVVTRAFGPCKFELVTEVKKEIMSRYAVHGQGFYSSKHARVGSQVSLWAGRSSGPTTVCVRLHQK